VRLCLWTAVTKRPVVHLPDDVRLWSPDGMTLTGKKPKNSEKNLTGSRFVHHKFHMDWPGPPRWEADD
jgi:hypothetical protein